MSSPAPAARSAATPKSKSPPQPPSQRQPLPARPMVRTLATLQRVSDIAPHPRIPTMCTGKAGGWSVVFPAALGLRDRERVIFFEDGSQFAAKVPWVREPSDAQKLSNFKVYAADMKGCPNEGHIVPVAALTINTQLAVLERVRAEAAAASAAAAEADDGDDGIDVTALLGVSKFCRTASEKLETIDDGSGSPSPAASAVAESSFGRSALWTPPKTAEIRGKTNEAKVFTAMRGLPYYITLKYNGSSITVLPHKDSTPQTPKLAVSSRNREVDPLSESADDRRYIAAASLLSVHGLPLLDGVQAEMVGPGIAWNEHQLPALSIRVFNMYRDQQLLGLDEMRAACGDMMVDVLEEGDAFNYTSASQLTHLMNKRLPCGQKLIEGIVIRPKTPRLVGGSSMLRDYQLSFKLLNIREEEKQDPADRK